MMQSAPLYDQARVLAKTLLGWAKLKLFSKLIKKKKTPSFRDEDE